jgi:hypothetical protein
LDEWTGLLAMAALDVWVSGPAPQSAFVMASEARDLMVEHARALEPAGVRLPAPGRYRGEGYLEPFDKALKELAAFLDSAV